MSQQVYPGNNTTALLMGTAEFSFSPGATTVAQANAAGFISIGNIAAFTPSVSPTIVEHFGSYQGVKTKDRTVVTQTKLEYQLKCDEWNREVLATLFGADQVAGHSQAAQSAVACDALTFTAQAKSHPERWYDLKVGAARIYRGTLVTAVAAPSTNLVEGTDFVVDLYNGRIRFLTEQSVTVTPSITAPAIAVTDATSYLKFTPLTDMVKDGIGKLIVYDQNDTNKVVFKHQDFSCEWRVESASELSGTDFTDITIVVSVTSLKGVVEVRQDNDMAGI